MSIYFLSTSDKLVKEWDECCQKAIIIYAVLFFETIETNFAQTTTQFNFKSYVYSEPSDSVLLFFCTKAFFYSVYVGISLFVSVRILYASKIMVDQCHFTCTHAGTMKLKLLRNHSRVWATHIWIRQQRSRINQFYIEFEQ